MALRSSLGVAILTAGLLLCGPADVFAQAAQGTAVREAPARSTNDARRTTMERLNKRATIDLNETPLADVFAFIEAVGDISVEAHWIDDGAAAGDGLDRETKVTLSVKDATLLTLLERVLERAQSPYGESTWQLTGDGVLEVGPKSRLNRRAFVKLYDVWDLVFQIPDFPNVPELDLDSVLQSGSRRGGQGGGGNIFQDPEDINIEDMLTEETMRAEALMNLIAQNVEPDQWVQNGGDGASMTILGQQLLIRAPDYIHRQIGGYSFLSQGRLPTPRVVKGVATETTTTAAGEPAPGVTANPAPASAPAQQP